MIRSNSTYSIPNSSINIYINKIYHLSSKGYIKFRGTISNKNGEIIEVKGYKLLLKNINRWIKVN